MTEPTLTAATVASPVLVVTGDEDLLDDLLRLCAAGGVVPDVAHEATLALRTWRQARLVLLGADLVDAMARLDPARRAAVHLVCRAEPSAQVFRAALESGAESVVTLPAAEQWLVECVTDAGDGDAGRAAPAVGIVGGSGGIGATTLTAALAVTTARSGPVAAIDVDPFGAGLDQVLGMDDLPGVHWGDLAGLVGRLGARTLRESLPRRDGLAVLGWGSGPALPVPTSAAREVLSAATRGHRAVLLDLPRTPSDLRDDLLGRCDLVLVLAGLSSPEITAAARVVGSLRDLARDLHLVVRDRPGGISPRVAAETLHLPLLGEVPRQRRLVEAVELGLGPVRSPRSPLAVVCRHWGERLGLVA